MNTSLIHTVFIYYLSNLARMLERIEQHSPAPETLLQSRLIADMLPLAQQVRAAASFSLRGCCPLHNKEIVSFSNDDASLKGLRRQLVETIAYLETVADEHVGDSASKFIQEEAGFATVRLPAESFLHQYCLPNFFFHLSMVYAIARKDGAPLTKGDFDGFHHYDPGFSFE
ncbi:DUF1993 domain-containing protein [Teredinibacter purpureus]|uniref:DUF1993 domain-containing protein n=1 Tax=Teredinibacter purpureus TaxID=2731756 RepID=UPI0005F87ACA|nr:DUF1993 domain-containing protein [Teredinibacter purpureus]